MSVATSPGELLGRTAVVTGSTSGIGRAIALELAAAGADVVVHGRTRRAAAEQVAEQIRGLGRQATVLLADLAEAAGHEPFVEQAWQWQGPIDIWVNNAGADVLTGAAAGWSFEEKLAHLWQVDVVATMRLSRLVGHRMQAQRRAVARGRRPRAGRKSPVAPEGTAVRPPGVILNMGWDQAECGMAGDSGEMFAAIKGAVMAFSKSLARSLAPQVRVNCLAPGWIKTAWGATATDYWQQRARRESLLERWGTPEDVARVARFLASPAADFITGHAVPINGGLRHG